MTLTFWFAVFVIAIVWILVGVVMERFNHPPQNGHYKEVEDLFKK